MLIWKKRYCTRWLPAVLGAVFVLAHADAGLAQTGMVKAGQQLLRIGGCKRVGGNLPGLLCLVREPINNPAFVHYHFRFDGIAVTHFHEQIGANQFVVRAFAGTDRSEIRYRAARPGQIVTIKAQACYRRAISFSSDCSRWAVFKLMR